VKDRFFTFFCFFQMDRLVLLLHGVLVGTPEENVKVFFDTAKSLTYPVTPELKL
jgi:hypothetical protein